MNPIGPVHSDTFVTRLLPLFGALEGDRIVIGDTVISSGKKYPLVVTPSFFRKFSCPTSCNVCCVKLPALTLDWVENEDHFLDMFPTYKDELIFRDVDFSRTNSWGVTSTQKILIRSLLKGDEKSRACKYLGPVEGREGLGCTLWPNAPVECLSAYSMMFGVREDRVLLSSRGVGRSWAYNPKPECGFEQIIDWDDMSQKMGLIDRYIEIADEMSFQIASRRLYIVLGRIRAMVSTCLEFNKFPTENLVEE